MSHTVRDKRDLSYHQNSQGIEGIHICNVAGGKPSGICLAAISLFGHSGCLPRFVLRKALPVWFPMSPEQDRSGCQPVETKTDQNVDVGHVGVSLTPGKVPFLPWSSFEHFDSPFHGMRATPNRVASDQVHR